MDVEQILALLPEGVLEELAVTTKVNRYSKKLQGELVFKLLLHCILFSHCGVITNNLKRMDFFPHSFAVEYISKGILSANSKEDQRIIFWVRTISYLCRDEIIANYINYSNYTQKVCYVIEIC